jgi:hypothetical protein
LLAADATACRSWVELALGTADAGGLGGGERAVLAQAGVDVEGHHQQKAQGRRRRQAAPDPVAMRQQGVLRVEEGGQLQQRHTQQGKERSIDQRRRDLELPETRGRGGGQKKEPCRCRA